MKFKIFRYDFLLWENWSSLPLLCLFCSPEASVKEEVSCKRMLSGGIHGSGQAVGRCRQF